MTVKAENYFSSSICLGWWFLWGLKTTSVMKWESSVAEKCGGSGSVAKRAKKEIYFWITNLNCGTKCFSLWTVEFRWTEVFALRVDYFCGLLWFTVLLNVFTWPWGRAIRRKLHVCGTDSGHQLETLSLKPIYLTSKLSPICFHASILWDALPPWCF